MGALRRRRREAILFAGVPFWLGFLTLGTGLFSAEPIELTVALDLPVSSAVIGISCLIPPVAYLVITTCRSVPLKARGGPSRGLRGGCFPFRWPLQPGICSWPRRPVCAFAAGGRGHTPPSPGRLSDYPLGISRHLSPSPSRNCTDYVCEL